MFFIKNGFEKVLSWPRKSPQTEKLFHQGISMVPKLCHTCLTSALTLIGGSLFSNQTCASFQKLRFGQNLTFCKTWVQKGSILNKEITSDWKKLFHHRVSMLPKLYQTYLTSALTLMGGIPIWCQRLPLYKNLDLVKIVFFIKHVFEKALSWPRKSPQT